MRTVAGQAVKLFSLDDHLTIILASELGNFRNLPDDPAIEMTLLLRMFSLILRLFGRLASECKTRPCIDNLRFKE